MTLLIDKLDYPVDVANRNFQRLRSAFIALQQDVYAVTQSYTFLSNDVISSLQVNAIAAALTITLPSPTGNRRRRIVKTDSSANTVTVGVSSTGQLINGGTTVVLTYQYEFVTVEPTGTGWLIVGRGTLTPSFNSITFPSTQVPSADPNTLDDYEEGTWLPSVGGNATYTNQQGTYTKIGRMVYVSVYITINVLGTGSSSQITGLPFTSGFLCSGTVGFWDATTVAYVHLACYVNFASSTIAFVGATGATTSTVGVTPMQSGTTLFLSVAFSV